MKIMQRLSLFLLLMISLTITGCGGDKSQTLPRPGIQSTGTLGQKLIDLYAAYLSGAIEEDKYQELKEELLERYEE